jgi:hypothetical protein
MKNDNLIFLSLLSLIFFISVVSCKKDIVSPNSLYTPTSADVTATASLLDLQTGRTLFINNCGQCHNYYAPENYSPSQWTSILNSMGPRTGMTQSEIQLVKKYVSKGK